MGRIRLFFGTVEDNYGYDGLDVLNMYNSLSFFNSIEY